MVLLFPRRCGEVAAGLVRDIQHWDTLPCPDGAQRYKYVLQRDNRAAYLLGLLVVVVLIITAIRAAIE